MSYSIKRECWNEHTFNGYEDSPYWRIFFEGHLIGLTDNGKYWDIDNCNPPLKFDRYIKDNLKRIIKECKLKIRLINK